MVVFPPAKINLGLRILRKRADGYHDIETVMVPTGWTDVLEVLPRPGQEQAISFQLYGANFQGDPADNLVVRAYHLLQREVGDRLGPVEVHLQKNIPAGAGLGGGSADAAYMLRALNELFALELSMADLHRLAAQLGSDVPFALYDRPMLATGTGTELTPLDVDLAGLYLHVVWPGVGIGTAAAYQGVTPTEAGITVAQVLAGASTTWQGSLRNDFEPSAAAAYPQVSEALDRLQKAGATYAAMSGSGSSCFGLFTKQPNLAWPQYYRSWSGKAS